MCKLRVISQERLKTEVKLLLSANRKSYMPRRLAQLQMTLSDIEWPFHTSRDISGAAELLVSICCLYWLNCLSNIRAEKRNTTLLSNQRPMNIKNLSINIQLVLKEW